MTMKPCAERDLEGDAQALERAADVIERRGKPKSFVVGVLCSVLRSQAAKVRAEAVR